MFGKVNEILLSLQNEIGSHSKKWCCVYGWIWKEQWCEIELQLAKGEYESMMKVNIQSTFFSLVAKFRTTYFNPSPKQQKSKCSSAGL